MKATVWACLLLCWSTANGSTPRLAEKVKSRVLGKVNSVVVAELKEPFAFQGNGATLGTHQVLVLTVELENVDAFIERATPRPALMLGDWECQLLDVAPENRAVMTCVAPRPVGPIEEFWLGPSWWLADRGTAKETRANREKVRAAAWVLAVHVPRDPSKFETYPDMGALARRYGYGRNSP
jgi:hypothetical protein